jgi:shikimate kinase
MGAGKSSVGQALGQRLNWIFEDLDDRIERRAGRSIREIFRESGESAFRAAEHSALCEVLAELEGGVARVIALGGGAYARKKNVALLKSAGAPTVFLKAPVDELWRRCCQQVKAAGIERPLQQNEAQFRRLYAARRASYGRALLNIETFGKDLPEIADEIARKLKLQPIAERMESGEVE